MVITSMSHMRGVLVVVIKIHESDGPKDERIPVGSGWLGSGKWTNRIPFLMLIRQIYDYHYERKFGLHHKI